MDKKQYILSLVDEFHLFNHQRVLQIQDREKDPIPTVITLVPYMIAGNFHFIPGFNRVLSSFAIYQFQMNERLKSYVRGYFNLREVPNIGTKSNAEIVAIYIYYDSLFEDTLPFFIFYNQNLYTSEIKSYLENKVLMIEEWIEKRFKTKISIYLLPAESQKIIKIKDKHSITVFDFYLKSIHLSGKNHYGFLLNKNVTEKQYKENISILNEHKWLSQESFFDLSYFEINKRELHNLISQYLDDILNLNFRVFHKLIYYHSLYQIDNLSQIYQKQISEDYYFELQIIKQFSNLSFKDLMLIEYIFLQQEKISDSRKEMFKSQMGRFESLNFLDDSNFRYREYIEINKKLKQFLNLLIEMYKVENRVIKSFFQNYENSIPFENLLQIRFDSESIIIQNHNSKWGVFQIFAKTAKPFYEEIYTTNSLMKTLIISLHNNYFSKTVPQIKSKSQTVIDENSNISRLKTKLVKQNLSFQKTIDIKTDIPIVEAIHIFINLGIDGHQNSSQNGLFKGYKDYSYISESWDPLNYGYQKNSHISDFTVVLKNSFQQISHFEYQSDESVVLAIKDIFSTTYNYNPSAEVSIQIFNGEISNSMIFRLKKLFENAYKTFSNRYSMLLTSFNGTLYLLKKTDKIIDAIIYQNLDVFFQMLLDEEKITHYYVDDDVLELSYFSKIITLTRVGYIQIFYFLHYKGNFLYVFDEDNHFYYFRNFNIQTLGDTVSLAINHIKDNDSIKNIEIYSIEERELNQFEIQEVDFNRFQNTDFISSPYKCVVEGIKSSNENFFSFRINNKIFSHKEFGNKAFINLIKYVGLNQLNDIRFCDLKTQYLKSGVTYRNFKYKLVVYQELKQLVTTLRDKWL
ncbi:hypothetical protein JXR93_08295 [bacterium]|nr:hypothetical protein [bacterium]